jgi:hypothetical protein
MRNHGRALIPVLLSAGLAWGAADVGTGFGERLWTLTSAREAGSGGIALEDPWRQGVSVDASNISLGSGLQWYGIGVEGGAGDMLRLGIEGFLFSAPGIMETRETEEGTWDKDVGKVDATEWGGRMVGQMMVAERHGWKLAGLARVSGLIQNLPNENISGGAIEVGGQGQTPLGIDRYLTAWVLTGPVGYGGNELFTRQVQLGGEIMGALHGGLTGREEGYAVGVDGRLLGEGLFTGGLGLVYWFGNHAREGRTYSLRGGMEYGRGSVEEWRPRFGLGILWRTAGGWGLQFDYAYAPMGELGNFNYLTLSMRLPEREVQEKYVPDLSEAPPNEPVITFYPQKGEKARIVVEAGLDAVVGASVRDRDGKLLMELVPPEVAGGGERVVEWDGLLQDGAPAPLEVPYYVNVLNGNQSVFYKVVPKDERGLH